MSFKTAFTQFVLLAVSVSSVAGQGVIRRFAGGGHVEGAPGLQTRLDYPNSCTVHPSGDVFLAELRRIRRISAGGGTVQTVVGNGLTTITGVDGPALEISISPQSVTLDKDGGIFFVDLYSVRRLDLRTGSVSTVAGSYSGQGIDADGIPAKNASLIAPRGLAIDRDGAILIAETTRRRIRRVDPNTGIITTVAGGKNPIPEFSGDGGPAVDAGFSSLELLAVDSQGNLFATDRNRIRRIDARTGVIQTVIGSQVEAYGGDGGPPRLATTGGVWTMSFDRSGRLLFGDSGRIRRIDFSRDIVETIAGTGFFSEFSDGVPALSAPIASPRCISLDSSDNLIFLDVERLRRISAESGLVSAIAGTGFNGDGGHALGAIIGEPMSMAPDANGNLFVSTQVAIHRIDRGTGLISVVAASPNYPDPLNLLPKLGFPVFGIALDSQGGLLIGETGRIRRLDLASGQFRTIAGTGSGGFGGDGGPASQALIGQVYSIALDRAGNIYFSESSQRVRRIDRGSGIITTFAGNGGQRYMPGSGSAVETSLGPIWSVSLDPSGNLYVSTISGDRIFKVSPAGELSVLGNGGCNYAGDGGHAAVAPICSPRGLAVDQQGNIFVSQQVECHCVRRIESETGIIQTAAGGKGQGMFVEGSLATQTSLSSPGALVISEGTLFVALADLDGTRVIASITPPSVPTLPHPPVITSLLNGASLSPSLVSPGLIVTLLGHYLSPPGFGLLRLDEKGQVAKEIHGVQVFVDDVALPMLYVSPAQINAVLPFDLSGKFLVDITVKGPGGNSAPLSERVFAPRPAIFPGAILNQDGTLNTPENPAERGSIITCFAAGLGTLEPAVPDGGVAGLPLPTLRNRIAVTYEQIQSPPPGRHNAEVLYAGPAPGFVYGVYQLNVRVSPTLGTGTATILILDSHPGHPVYVK